MKQRPKPHSSVTKHPTQIPSVAQFEQAMALHQRGQIDQAAAIYRDILTQVPEHFGAMHLLGVAENQKGHAALALTYYERALALHANNAAVYSNRGLALHALGRLQEALTSFDRAIALNAKFVEPNYNRGKTLLALGRHEEALTSYDRALALQASCLDAWLLRAQVLELLARYPDALLSYERALKLQPDNAAIYVAQANVLKNLQHWQAALDSYRRALDLKPDFEFLFGSWLHLKMAVCDWTDLEAAFETLATGIHQGQKISAPFPLFATPLPLALQKKCAEIYVQSQVPIHAQPFASVSRASNGGRIRVGYFSADFRNHPVSYLTAGMFEHHDRAQFEVFAFSFGSTTNDSMRQRLLPCFDRFIEVGLRSDAEAIQLAREQGIDIAVDLMGFTSNNRAGVFAGRAAPVQVNFLGYPGTMGASYIDYLVADATVVAPEHVVHYTEKIVYLPHTFQVNDDRRPNPTKQLRRQDVGLPAQGFVFCSFNNSHKITPTEFDIWMRLLHQVPDSVLWLADSNEPAFHHLRSHAQARGIGIDRLVFKRPVENLLDHLAQIPLADLFLDSFCYGAHTTASDALWFGVPVLTCLGPTFASRVAASLLQAIGLPELITHSHQAYEARALELATDTAQLAQLKQRLVANRTTYPLFNTTLYTQHMEAAYRAMWQRHAAGLAPDHIRL